MTQCSIAVIPARGGSKRVPRKNVKDFCGKPMIAWTIEAALRSGVFDHVLVSTDDREIAEVAVEWGAEVPFLRQTASDDITPVSVATLHALDQAEEHWGKRFGYVAQLMANCPLRGCDDIVNAWENFISKKVSFQLSCFKYGFMNPWWAHTLDVEGHPTAMFKDATTQRSQDLADLFCPTGAIWLAAVDALRDKRTFYGPGHVFCPLSWQAALDIDNEDDLALAKSVYPAISGLSSTES